MSDVTTIHTVNWTLSDGTTLPALLPIIVPGSPTTTYILSLMANLLNISGGAIAPDDFTFDWDITDPKRNHYGGVSQGVARNDFPICLIGIYYVQLTITDSVGASAVFTKRMNTVCVYNSGDDGCGYPVWVAIPVDGAGTTFLG